MYLMKTHSREETAVANVPWWQQATRNWEESILAGAKGISGTAEVK